MPLQVAVKQNCSDLLYIRLLLFCLYTNVLNRYPSGFLLTLTHNFSIMNFYIQEFNRCLIICIVLSLGLWFISKSLSGAKEIPASLFIVEDENGKSHGGLSVLMGGSVLVPYNENKKCRAELKVYKVGPIVSLFDENVKPIWPVPERVGVIPLK